MLAFESIRRFPLSRSSRSKDSFNDSHIPDRVLYRNRNFSIFENCLRESIPLQRVLIADRESLCRDPAAENILAAVDKEPGRPVRRSIERDLQLNPSSRAK